MGKAETSGCAQRNCRLQELPGRIVLGRDQIKTSIALCNRNTSHVINPKIPGSHSRQNKQVKLILSSRSFNPIYSEFQLVVDIKTETSGVFYALSHVSICTSRWLQ